MKKKVLALVLCLSLLLATFATIVVSAEVDTASIFDSETNTYTVSNADEWIAVVDEINNNSYLTRNITLAGNIHLAGKTCDPIAKNTIHKDGSTYPAASTYYSGTINGAGFTISNWTATFSAGSKGLVAMATGSCTIKDLTLDNVKLSALSELGALIGDIGGYSVGTITIDGCTVKNSEIVASSGGNVGGFVGTVRSCDSEKVGVVLVITNSSVVNCIIEGLGNQQNGGFVGSVINYGTLSISNCSLIDSFVSGKTQVGGFLGKAEDKLTGNTYSFTNCTVDLDPSVKLTKTIAGKGTTGTVSPIIKAANGHDVGGIVGYSKESITFTDCTVIGEIKTTARHAGGLLGRQNLGGTIIANRCAVNATISGSLDDGNSGIGGLIGIAYVDALVIDIDNCFVAGTLHNYNTGEKGYLAGFAGRLKDATDKTATNSVCIADITSDGTTNLFAFGGSNRIEATNCYSNNAILSDKTNLEIIDMIPTLFAQEDDAATADINEKALADAFIEKVTAIAWNQTLTMAGYQTNPDPVLSTNDKYNVRFVAYIDSKSYAEAGLQIQAKINGEYKTADNFAVTAVYESIYAKIGDNTQTISVENLGHYGSGYIIAVKVNGVPMDVTEFIVTPYVKTAASADPIYGTASNVSVKITDEA